MNQNVLFFIFKKFNPEENKRGLKTQDKGSVVKISVQVDGKGYCCGILINLGLVLWGK
jgi:hypothetical protein